MPTTFRLHIRPTGGLASKRAAFEHCLANGVLGLGWALPNPTNRSIEWVRYHAEAALYYGSAKELSRVVYLHDRLVAGDLVWTRDLDGIYYLARALAAWYVADRSLKLPGWLGWLGRLPRDQERRH